MYIYIIQYAPDQQRKVLTIEKLVTQGGSTFKGEGEAWYIPHARKQVFWLNYADIRNTLQIIEIYTT